MDVRLKIAEKIANDAKSDDYGYALEICHEILRSADCCRIDAYLAHEICCSIYSSIGDFSKAIEEASAMIDLESGQPHPFFKRARLFLRSGNNAGAVGDLTRVIGFDENYFKESAYFLRSFANININKKRSISDANKVSENFSLFVRAKDFESRLISRGNLLDLIKNK